MDQDRCYICNAKFPDIWNHFKLLHRNHLPCLVFQRSLHYPLVLTLSNKKPKRKLRFGVGNHYRTAETQRAWLRYDMSESAVVPHLEKYPPVKPIFLIYMPSDYFGDFPESLVIVGRTDPRFLPFDMAARAACESCGGYGRKRHCPPVIYSSDYYREWMEEWDHAYFFIWQSDGRAGWPKQPKGVGIRWGRTLRGTDMGLSVASYGYLQEAAEQLRNSGADTFICTPGPCKRCTSSGGCSLPIGSGLIIPGAKVGFCPHPMGGGVTPESMGIDVIRTILGMGIPIQQPVLDFVTKVGIILTKGGDL